MQKEKPETKPSGKNKGRRKKRNLDIYRFRDFFSLEIFTFKDRKKKRQKRGREGERELQSVEVMA